MSAAKTFTIDESTNPKTFVIPDFFTICPIEYYRNPHHDAAEAASSEWINSYGFFDSHQLEIFMKSKNELLASYAYPYANYEQLRTCCDFINLLIAVDEISDEQDSIGATQTIDTCVAALQDPSFDDGSNLTRMCKDFLVRLEGTPPPVVKRFIQHCVDYLNAVKQESKNRQAHHTLCLWAYEPLRRNNGATMPCFDLMEYIYGAALPEDVWEDYNFMNMWWTATDLVNWPNDSFSWNKEQASGHYCHNVTSVIMKQENCSVQRANDIIAEHCDVLMKAFFESKKNLRSFGSKEVDDTVAFYIKGLEHWISGNLIWSYKSGRYFGDASEEVFETRVVQVRPRKIIHYAPLAKEASKTPVLGSIPSATSPPYKERGAGHGLVAVYKFARTRLSSFYSMVVNIIHKPI